MLSAFNIVEETAEDTFKPTAFSYAIGDESTKVCASLQAAYVPSLSHLACYTDLDRTYQYLSAGHNLPAYLAKTLYKEPTDFVENNHSETDPDGLNFFGRLQQSPNCYEAFTGHMEAWTAWKTPWTTVYDTARLLDGARLDNGSPFVVDVGGNTGIDISHVLAKHPDLPAGSLVLQDLPEIIATAQVDEKVKAMSHDFFLPQPVKGTVQKPYLLHTC